MYVCMYAFMSVCMHACMYMKTKEISRMTNTMLAWEEIKLYQLLKVENMVDFVILCNTFIKHQLKKQKDENKFNNTSKENIVNELCTM